MQRGGRRFVFMILILLGASGYGMLSPMVKLAYGGGWNDAQITVSQTTMGAVFSWLIVLAVRQAWTNPFRGAWVRMVLIGIFGLALTTVLYNTALSELDATLAIVLLFQFTWITIGLESIVSRRRPTRYQLLAVVLVLAGTLLSVDIFGGAAARFSWRGLGFGLAAAVAYSLVLFGTSRLRDNVHMLMKSAVMLTAGLPFVWLLYPQAVHFEEGTGHLLLWGLMLGVVGQVLPTVCFNIGIPRVGSSTAAMLAAMELPVAIICALLLVGEAVRGVQWAGMLLILAGIAVSEMKPGGKPGAGSEVS